MNPGPQWPQALLEVCLCTGLPTQLLVKYMLALGGVAPGPGDTLTLPFLVSLTAIDTVLLVGLVVGLLILGGESPRQVLLGARPVGREVLRGFAIVPWIFAVVFVAAISIHWLAPQLVTPNPFASLATGWAQILVFALTVTVAGGVREEIQRAFILHRCEQRLGGAVVGVVGWGLLFGLGHLLQGWSVVIITALLGMFWSLVYLRRRSVIAPMVSHASFNLIEVIGLTA